MEGHPPLFPEEELSGLPSMPQEVHENVIPLASASPEASPLTPIFNPVGIVTAPAPENRELTLAEAAAKYKEMVGVWPEDDLPEATIRAAIVDPDAAQHEHQRLLEITRREDAEEIHKLYRG